MWCHFPAACAAFAGKINNLSAECADVLEGLLDPDQDTRLGSTEVDPEGMHNLRDHPWLKSIDWKKLQEGKTDGPLGEKSKVLVEEVGFMTLEESFTFTRAAFASPSSSRFLPPCRPNHSPDDRQRP